MMTRVHGQKKYKRQDSTIMLKQTAKQLHPKLIVTKKQRQNTEINQKPNRSWCSKISRTQTDRSWSAIKTKLSLQRKEKIQKYQNLVQEIRKKETGIEMQKMERFVLKTLWQLDERVCRDLCMRQFSLTNTNTVRLTNVKTCRSRFIR